MCDNVRGDMMRTLNKVRAAVYRVGFNLWDMFKPLDPSKCGLISEQKFMSVLLGPLQKIIGLSEQEIQDIGRYFSVQDGRVYYRQFCELIHDTKLEGPKPKEEEEDLNPYYVNPLPTDELKHLQIMLTKIALQTTSRKLVLKPFFQDYELVKKKGGLITKGSFGRVLSFLNIHLSPKEYILFLKRYSQDTSTVRYMAFIKEVSDIIQYFEDHNYLDLSGNLLPSYQVSSPDNEFKYMPRPELIPAPTRGPEYGIQKIFSPNWKEKTSPEELLSVLKKIQDHVYKEKTRVGEYFEMYDTVDCGRVSEAVFRMGLEAFSHTSTGMGNLYLSKPEIRALCLLYADTDSDPSRMLWKVFRDDIEAHFDPKEMEKWPEEKQRAWCQRMEKMRQRQLERMPVINPPPTKDSVLSTIKRKIVKRNISLRPIFAEYDVEKYGHVSWSNLNNVLVQAAILSTDDELHILKIEYSDEFGIDYRKFLKDLDDTPYVDHETIAEEKKAAQLKKMKEEEERLKKIEQESNIVYILAKVKRVLICYRARMEDFLSPFDRLNHQVVSRDNFKRGLEASKVELTPNEVDTIMDVFSLPKDKQLIEYKRFCKTIDEKTMKPCPTARVILGGEGHGQKEQPGKVYASHGDQEHFLNYNERQVLSLAMKKMSEIMELGDLDKFKEIDTAKTGRVNRKQFFVLLQNLGALEKVTVKEVEIVLKAFGKEDELDPHLDYQALLNAVDIVFRTQKASQAL